MNQNIQEWFDIVTVKVGFKVPTHSPEAQEAIPKAVNDYRPRMINELRKVARRYAREFGAECDIECRPFARRA